MIIYNALMIECHHRVLRSKFDAGVAGHIGFERGATFHSEQSVFWCSHVPETVQPYNLVTN